MSSASVHRTITGYSVACKWSSIKSHIQQKRASSRPVVLHCRWTSDLVKELYTYVGPASDLLNLFVLVFLLCYVYYLSELLYAISQDFLLLTLFFHFYKSDVTSMMSLKTDLIVTLRDLFFGTALSSSFVMSQKQSYTAVNCTFHIRNVIKFSHLEIISNKLNPGIHSLSSTDGVCFTLMLAWRFCYKLQERVCVFNKEMEFPSLKEQDWISDC